MFASYPYLPGVALADLQIDTIRSELDDNLLDSIFRGGGPGEILFSSLDESKIRFSLKDRFRSLGNSQINAMINDQCLELAEELMSLEQFCLETSFYVSKKHARMEHLRMCFAYDRVYVFSNQSVATYSFASVEIKEAGYLTILQAHPGVFEVEQNQKPGKGQEKKSRARVKSPGPPQNPKFRSAYSPVLLRLYERLAGAQTAAEGKSAELDPHSASADVASRRACRVALLRACDVVVTRTVTHTRAVSTLSIPLAPFFAAAEDAQAEGAPRVGTRLSAIEVVETNRKKSGGIQWQLRYSPTWNNAR